MQKFVEFAEFCRISTDLEEVGGNWRKLEEMLRYYDTVLLFYVHLVIKNKY
jgi:hypothetical protein